MLRNLPCFLILTVSIALGACKDNTSTEPELDILAGLSAALRNDTTPVPPATAPTTPGQFVGVVYGFTPGVTDTIATAVTLSGVSVRAYDRSESAGEVRAGTLRASVTTNSIGEFALPTLPGGEYVVVFEPASGSGYQSGWTVGLAWEESGSKAWFIMLAAE